MGGEDRMFVITIGPIGKYWGRMVKILAIGVVLLLIALVAWRVMGSMSGAGPGGPEGPGQALATFGGKLGAGFWQRFMSAVEQWFKQGF